MKRVFYFVIIVIYIMVCVCLSVYEQYVNRPVLLTLQFFLILEYRYYPIPSSPKAFFLR
jgi:hypothetical protein